MAIQKATQHAHILGQWYLKNFTNTWTKEGKIFCYNLEKWKYIDNDGVSTKGLWWRPCTYSQRNKKLNKREDEIEKRFNKDETKITSWIDDLLRELDWIKNPWDTIDRSKIDENCVVAFILLIMTKAVWERIINNQLVINEITKIFEDAYRDLLNNDEKPIKQRLINEITKIFEDFNKDLFNNKEWIEKPWRVEIEKAIQKSYDEFDPKNQVKELFSNFLTSVVFRSSFIQALRNKNWMLLYIRDENYEFCVSDFPIYLRPDNNSLHSFVENPQVEINIPLSKNLLLSIGWGFERKRQYSVLSSHDELIKIIKQANQMLIANATWYVAWSKKSFVDELINSKEINPYTPNFFSSIDKIFGAYIAKIPL